MKRDKKYLLIIDEKNKKAWFKKLNYRCVMNAVLLMKTYYSDCDLYDHLKVIGYINNNFSDYKMIELRDDYIESLIRNINWS